MYEEGRLDGQRALVNRLRRAEGQIRGIRTMIHDDQACIDVLTQVSAVTHALDSVGLALLRDLLARCIADASATGGHVDDQRLREIGDAIARLARFQPLRS